MRPDVSAAVAVLKATRERTPKPPGSYAAKCIDLPPRMRGLIVKSSGTLNLRYLGLWNSGNRHDNIVAAAALSAHDANL
jgi:hypothetical protein